MALFPVGLGELSILFAVTALVLLITSEMLSPYHRRINILVSRKRMRNAAILFSVLFLTTVAIEIYLIISTL